MIILIPKEGYIRIDHAEIAEVLDGLQVLTDRVFIQRLANRILAMARRIVSSVTLGCRQSPPPGPPVLPLPVPGRHRQGKEKARASLNRPALVSSQKSSPSVAELASSREFVMQQTFPSRLPKSFPAGMVFYSCFPCQLKPDIIEDPPLPSLVGRILSQQRKVEGEPALQGPDFFRQSAQVPAVRKENITAQGFPDTHP